MLTSVIHRIQLSRAKHRSLHGHARMSKRLARLVPFYDYGPDRFFAADGAPFEVAERRRAGFARLAHELATRAPRTLAATAAAAESISDLQFTEPLSRAVPVPAAGRRAAAGRQLRRIARTACGSAISTATSPST